MSTPPPQKDQLEEARRVERSALTRNFAWAAVGNVVYAASQWGLVVVLARLATPSMLGRFILALAVTGPLILLANLNLRALQAADAGNEFKFAEYLALRLLTTGVVLFLLMCCVLVVPSDAVVLIAVVGVARAAEAISDVVYGYLQQHERMERIARSMILNGCCALLAMAVAVYSSGSVLLGAAAFAAAKGLVVLLYDLPCAASLAEHSGTTAQPTWCISTLGKISKTALPLGLVMLLLSVNGQVPRYFLVHLRGEEALGLFAAPASLMVVGSTIALAMGQSASARLAASYARGDLGGFLRIVRVQVGLGVVLGAVGVLVSWAWGEAILGLLFGAEYTQGATLFIWLMVAAALTYVASFLGFGMTAARRFRQQVPLFCLVTAGTTVSCALLIPGHGLMGAAWAVLVGVLIQLIGSSYVLVRAVRASSLRA